MCCPGNNCENSSRVARCRGGACPAHSGLTYLRDGTLDSKYRRQVYLAVAGHAGKKDEMRKLRVRVRFVVDVHQLADGGMRVLLRGGKRLVAEQFLDGSEIRPVREQMCGESMAQRVGM